MCLTQACIDGPTFVQMLTSLLLYIIRLKTVSFSFFYFLFCNIQQSERMSDHFWRWLQILFSRVPWLQNQMFYVGKILANHDREKVVNNFFLSYLIRKNKKRNFVRGNGQRQRCGKWNERRKFHWLEVCNQYFKSFLIEIFN